MIGVEPNEVATIPLSSATRFEGATAEFTGWGVCFTGADMRHRQSEEGQQLPVAGTFAQPETSALQVLGLIGKPSVSRSASRTVKHFTAACMRDRP